MLIKVIYDIVFLIGWLINARYVYVRYLTFSVVLFVVLFQTSKVVFEIQCGFRVACVVFVSVSESPWVYFYNCIDVNTINSSHG